ncbi:hypothetical protein [Algoriphagus sp. AK58]|uniref:hypothetical protein n=1 Tax=Algoriphagus sp. AK58 TaxID=1406877 RepID=UPI001650845B|nr:hypothetical protein [Algoriphagus sp. AK58]MBC6368507.1 hypothetical protein [Algoriphagus sp. AK58]
MKSRHLIYLVLVFLSISACKEENTGPDPRLNQPEEFKKLLDAHGDWNKWIDAKSFSFAMVHETTLEWENHYLDLQNGKARIDADLFQAGNDGEKVWISPNRKAFPGQSVRFYHNLYSTFLSIPYVLTDTLVTVKKGGNREFNGKTFETLDATLKEGKLLGPSNRYTLLIDPETGKLAWVLFSVKYFNPNNQVEEALFYDDYRDAGGLIFPRVITGYEVENDSSRRIRYQVSFSDVFLLEESLKKDLYEMPKSAVAAN